MATRPAQAQGLFRQRREARRRFGGESVIHSEKGPQPTNEESSGAHNFGGGLKGRARVLSWCVFVPDSRGTLRSFSLAGVHSDQPSGQSENDRPCIPSQRLAGEFATLDFLRRMALPFAPHKVSCESGPYESQTNQNPLVISRILTCYLESQGLNSRTVAKRANLLGLATPPGYGSISIDWLQSTIQTLSPLFPSILIRS